MALRKHETTVCEAIDTMLRHKVALGLQDLPKDAKEEEEHSFQFLHEQINEMFAIKAAGLTHHDGICAAFHKVHNYKFITDPTFRRSVDEEMKSQGIPAAECEQVLDYIPAIISEIKKDDWCERDFGFNPNLGEIIKVSKPGMVESRDRMCEEDDLDDEEEIDEEEDELEECNE